MNKSRILTAIVLLPLLVSAILKAPLWFLAFLATAATLIAWHEFTGMAKFNTKVFILGGLALVGSFLAIYFYKVFAPGLWLGFFLILLYFLKHYKRPEDQKDFLFSLAGYAYVFLGFSHLYLVLTLPEGRFWFLVLIATIFGTDTGAYYTGRTLGKHKLSPVISPKKTWEGAIGGTLLGVILATGLNFVFGLASLAFILPLAFLASIVGQMGDLMESIIKRGFGVKDSGSLLPGHGGILDRVDALIFAAPLFYWLIIWYHG
ncbi:phosphatidate cytidylyltransferase [Thermodesulfatator indicus DSM 15286]|uniref:Phosphatidate cytidylyltransferase n=1 Tax=Thermodesulfatator indicus (strain DSM 15286 / JCM 11887 / CIR29812) TaxID=667014 RepID=F8ADC3_THEID|nr:phosphatidate cytidylyltransferase [Thermodesulfatator indicus]AEH45938.1 phosphatidate cytidylyltransferase [Thermodesulfatator indicus DSM 15286]